MAVDDQAFEAYKRRVAGVYDRAAPLYGQAGIPFFQHAGQRLVEVAGVSPSSRVLDVAAGRGAVLFPAAERVGASGRAVGIDLSEAMVRETAADITRRGVANAEMHQMDAERIAFQDGAFDFVLCSFALFFFPRLEQALAEFRRVLRSGGTVGIGHGGAESDPRWKWENEVLKRYPVPEPMN